MEHLSDQEIKEFDHAISEIVVEMSRIAAARSQIKEILDVMKDKFEIKPKRARAIAKAVFESEKFDPLIEELEENNLLLERIEMVRKNGSVKDYVNEE